MSKDFGIAGIRAGYGVTDKYKVSKFLKNGYLWNSSGLSEYFLGFIKEKIFLKNMKKVRKQYIIEAQNFLKSYQQYLKSRFIQVWQILL